MFIMLSKRHLLIVIFLLFFLFGAIFYLFLPSAQTTVSWSMAAETIVLDAGHGGIFPGKVSTNGIEEKDINLIITRHLQSYLAQSGARIIMTRTTDTQLDPEPDLSRSLLSLQRADLQKRVAIAANCEADYFISIHCNSIPSEQWHGAQIFYRPDDAQSQALAEAIQEQLCRQLGNTDRRALPRQDTYLFENLTMPAVIVECGFLSNPEETELLQEDLYQQKIAHAVYLGLSDYLTHY